MQATASLNYDGTFNGLLTCIFLSYEEKLEVIAINPPDANKGDFFSEILEVITDKSKANRVLKAFKSYVSARGANSVYNAYLSEEPGIELEILKYFQYTFKHKNNVDGDFTNPHVLKIAQTAKKVRREKHRMEAFVRFQLTKDNIYFATIAPDFNVLPLINKHFTSRYSDQHWIIYDTTRKFGLYYDLHKTEIISFDFSINTDKAEANQYIFNDFEMDFQELWKKYFEATTIRSRINTRLHHQHLPKRYWKYLIEKNPLHN
ncbi:TIGR03915 family putative DNA repair protein [Salegentibacter sp. JZCK2]|uniref:TIGR03915 family putative DNA repair protein n=1 Tax=Salegentibacter tibetensis TaxID=2873600 RepID=UPI001CCD0133|nr:TIGR03915 family putative DNA repair protein [Salegentibacter tibetensis]MBZ9728357.1 TIGR03915 family putative DNA repair protein [Salegentibacter tibetensis]